MFLRTYQINMARSYVEEHMNFVAYHYIEIDYLEPNNYEEISEVLNIISATTRFGLSIYFHTNQSKHSTTKIPRVYAT